MSNTGANRANIALAELGLSFEERTINVDGPRPADFLALNLRGLVPVLVFDGHVLVESHIICQFLADRFPKGSQLCPPPTSPEGALRRAQMAFFIDAYWTRFHTRLFQLFEAPTRADEEAIVAAAVDEGLAREVEPLLRDAAPFWGGSDKLTLAEVLMGPFVVRAVALSRHGVYPASLNTRAEAAAPHFFKWAAAVAKHPSITAVFDEDVHVARSIAKRARMRKAAGLE